MKPARDKIKFYIFITLILFFILIGKFIKIDFDFVKSQLSSFPLLYSGIIFVILYCFLTFFIWLSKDILRFVAAFVFGPFLSTFFIFIAETINAFILFNFSRALGKEYILKAASQKHLSSIEKLSRINFFWLFMFRLTPLVPFRFLDMACGLTNISFKKYLLAVIFGSPIRIFWVQFFLASLGLSLLTNVEAVKLFLFNNVHMLWLSIAYIVLVFIVAIKIKRVG